jgi:hypothetical protein
MARHGQEENYPGRGTTRRTSVLKLTKKKGKPQAKNSLWFSILEAFRTKYSKKYEQTIHFLY